MLAGNTVKAASVLMCKQDFKSIYIDWNAYKFMFFLIEMNFDEKKRTQLERVHTLTCNFVNGSKKSSNLCDLILGLCYFVGFMVHRWPYTYGTCITCFSIAKCTNSHNSEYRKKRDAWTRCLREQTESCSLLNHLWQLSSFFFEALEI